MYRFPTCSREILSDEELEKLKYAIRNSTKYLCNTAGEFLRRRDETIILLAAYAGLRPCETLRLQWSDINFKNKLIHISPWNNKQRASAPAIMSEKAKSLLIEYKKFFDQYLKNPFLFPSLITLEPITSSAMAKIFLTLTKEAGIHRVNFWSNTGQPMSNKTFYSLRKYYGNRIFNRSGSEYATMRALRQTKISSIKPYVDMHEKKLKEIVDYSLSDN